MIYCYIYLLNYSNACPDVMTKIYCEYQNQRLHRFAYKFVYYIYYKPSLRSAPWQLVYDVTVCAMCSCSGCSAVRH